MQAIVKEGTISMVLQILGDLVRCGNTLKYEKNYLISIFLASLLCTGLIQARTQTTLDYRRIHLKLRLILWL